MSIRNWVEIGYERGGYASLNLHYRDDAGEIRLHRVEWVGDVSLPVQIDDRVIERLESSDEDYPEALRNFPWPLQLTDVNLFSRCGIYVRTDIGLPGRALYWRLRFRAIHIRQLLKRRIIATFWVWGMAEKDCRRIPAWTDIRCIKRIRDFLMHVG